MPTSFLGIEIVALERNNLENKGGKAVTATSWWLINSAEWTVRSQAALYFADCSHADFI